MISKHISQGLTWIDLASPTADEISSLQKEYGLPLLVNEEMLVPNTRSKVDSYEDMLYLILHFPVLSRPNTDREIDFVIGKDFIITTHYEPVTALTKSIEAFESGALLGKEGEAAHTGHVFFYVMRELYRHASSQLEDINRSLVDIEREIFRGTERTMVEVISAANRKIIDFKQAVRFHDEVLRSFETTGASFFGGEFSHYLRGIMGEYNKVKNTLDGHTEILRDLRETNDSLLTNRTNEAMRVLTVLNFIMLPLALIASVFGMNSEILFIQGLGDFLIVIAGMSVVGLAMFAYFRRKRWI